MRIRASLERLCEIFAPEWDELDVEALQALTDAVLDARPALCPESLERSLDSLRLAAEELGRTADAETLVARTLQLMAKPH